MELEDQLKIHFSYFLIIYIYIYIFFFFQDKNHVSEGVFALPECAVSESTECLVNLAYQTLQEASSNTPQW